MSPDPQADPHAKHRRLLLARHPEIAQLIGHDGETAVLGALAVGAQLAIAAALQWSATRMLWPGHFRVVLLAAFLVGAVLSHLCGAVMHEATHNLCARGATANRLIALLMNIPIPIPAAMAFRRFHLEHHRHFRRLGLDRDLPSRFEVRWLVRTVPGRVLWLLAFPLFATLLRGHQRGPDRWEVAGFAIQLAVDAAIWLCLGPTALLYLFLCALFLFGAHPVSAHFLHEHDLFSDEAPTNSYYGRVNALALNVGYHSEHHDFPGVPGTRLPRLHAIARAHYLSQPFHRSTLDVVAAYFRPRPPERDSHLVRAIEARRPSENDAPSASVEPAQ